MLDDDDDEFIDAELADGEIWSPEPELEEDSFVIESALKLLPKNAAVRPSQFTEHAFQLPDYKSTTGFKKFSFDSGRHMRRIYDTPARRVLLICGRQVGKSTLIGNIALCYSCMIPSYRTLYVSASSTQAKVFSNDRLREPIETSPILKRFTTTMLSSNILEKQFVNRSKITLRYAYLNADRCRGIPAYLLAIDEFQDILSDNIPIIEQCLFASPEELRRYIYSGTPKSLDNNIEFLRANKSTQAEWVVPCDRHKPRHWNILGEKNIGKHGLICEKCRQPIDSRHPDAQWAKQVKEADFESYRIPQLIAPTVVWSDVLYHYRTDSRQKFYNEVLGVSYDSGLRPLTTEQVRVCCNPDVKMIDSKSYRQLSYSQPVFAGLDHGCHDEETRILTTEGFKHFRDLTDADKVAQWDPDSLQMSFTKPKVRTIRDWTRPLLHFETRGGLDLMVTDTHRMRVSIAGKDEWVTEPAANTVERGGNIDFVGRVNWVGKEQETFVLPGLPKSPGYGGSAPLTVRMDDWVEFVGYLVSEGGLCFGDSGPSCIKITQREEVNAVTCQRLRALFIRLGISSYTEFPDKNGRDTRWTIYGKQYWKWYQENLGTHCDDKRLPRELLNLPKRQLKILFDAMVDGDGTIDKRENCTGGAYYSTSKGLCEDFQEICIRLGLRCLVRLHKPADETRKARYRALFSSAENFQFNTPRTKVKHVPYNGKVYCCSVPTGYIVTERNGCISYQGNTGENSYSVLVLATYVNMKFRVFYVHRFVGEDVDPEPQLAKIVELLRYFNVKFIGSDYGGGFDRNDHLVRKFGPKRVWKYQYLARAKKKVEWDSKLGRFKVHRTEVMSDIFNAIKRKQCEFPAWDEFDDPYARDMLNIYSEYNNQLHMTQYGHRQDKPDDTFHALLYAWLVSMMYRPRPDILTARREDKRGFQEQVYSGPVDQG